MTAAIYARKSTEQSAVANEAKSIARQIEHAKTYAIKKGWAVDERFIFSDDAVSGAEFGKRRPGLLRLMNALKPKPEFQVLIMSEESRLGRDRIKTEYHLQSLTEAGVRIFFYLTDQEARMDDATSALLGTLKLYAAQMEREKAQQRVYDTMVRKAKAGHVTGGTCFGYTNVVITDASGRRSHVEYQINPAEAAVVKRIFELYVAGHGFQTIAKLLNAEHAHCPRARPLSKPAGWASSSIREVLLRPLYHGQQTWGRTKKRLASGMKRPHKRAEEDWLVIDLPHLQIIDDATWQEAQNRWNNVRAVYLRGTNGRLHGRPTNGRESPYLLTGFTCCGHCGGSVYVRSRSHGNRRAYHYCCVVHYQRGPEACPERLLLPVPDADRAILTALEQDVMQPAIITKALEKALQQLQTDQEDPADRKEVLLKELHSLEAELNRFTQAIAAGGWLPTIMSAIQEREARRVKVQAELALLDVTPIGQLDAGEIEQELRGYLKDWSSLTSRHPAQTRQILRKLLPSRIRLSHDAKGVCHFEGTAAVGRMISGMLGNQQGKRLGVPNGI
jgi:site-specific DNA recombinase